jgi:nitrilase
MMSQLINPFKASVVQTASVAFDPWRTIDKLNAYTQRAVAQDARLVVFPEGFVGGHAKGAWVLHAGRSRCVSDVP